jgi:hypothetical protein
METPKLSPAKINPTKLLPGISISTKKISTESLQEESVSVLKSDLFIIKKQVFKVRDLIQTSTLIKQSELEKKRKSTEKKEAETQENKLEAKPDKKEGKLKMPSVPKLGFLDRIKNFLFSILLGYISIKLLPHLPKLVGIVKIIGNVMEFMIDLGGNILDKVVTFIDWGYKAIDATRGFMKSFGGDFSLKIFDTFTGTVSGVIDAAIIAALALSTQGMGGGGGPDGGKGGGPLKSGKQLWKEYDQKRAFIRKKHGDAAARIYDNEISNGKTPKQAFENLKKRYISKGKIVSQRQLGLGEIKGSKLFGKGIDKVPGRLVTRILGRSGKKAILGFARPFLKRLPIIGALIDFGLSVALGEDPGRAAFKAIGAGLLGFVGAAIGTVVPVAGNLVGGIIGGIAGDALGGALYDMFFGGKKPKAQKSQAVKAAGGGPAPVTRGNKIVGGAVKRTISRKPVKRGVKVQVTKVKPGSSIGGKKKIEKIFPEVPTKDKGKNVNPLGYMQSSYNIATKTPSFGALFALPLKAQLGEKPSSVDYMKAAEELSGWMQNTFRGTAGYAGGGKVEAGIFGGDDMTKIVAKSLEETISSKVDAAIKELQKQLMLKEEEKKSDDKKTGPDGGEGGFEVGAAGNSGDALTMARNLMRDLGLTADQAAGIVGNMVAESGVENARPQNTPPGTKGVLKVDDVTGYGIVQWTSRGRQQALADYAKSKGADLSKPLSMDIEYQFFLKEFKGQYGQVLSQIKQAKDVKTASTIFMQQYEVPEGHKTEAKIMERYNKSKPIYDKLAKGEGKATEGPGTYIASPTISSGTGGTYGVSVQGTKNAGNLGRYMYQALRSGDDFSQVSEHPDFGGSFTRSYRSWHNVNRAVDIGGYWPKDQVKILAKVEEFNKKNNVKPVELLYGKPGTPESGSHGDHVHVAYAKGGRVLKPTLATLAEDGRPEFVFDADTTRGFDGMAPLLLEKLNAAETKPQLMKVLQSYMGGSTQISANYGGMIKKPSLAIIAERGKEEFLLGGRTTELFNSLNPNLLEKINAAKTKPQLADILLSATYGGAAAERQQKIDAFMNQKGMPAGKGFQGRSDMFGREYDPNTGKLKQASAVKELNNIQISQQMSSLLKLTGILQSYAGYEDGAEQTVIVMNSPQMVPIPIPTGNSGSIGGMSRSSSIDTTYDTLYA